MEEVESRTRDPERRQRPSTPSAEPGRRLDVHDEAQEMLSRMSKLEERLLRVRRELAILYVEDLGSGIIDHLGEHVAAGESHAQEVRAYVQNAMGEALAQIEDSTDPVSFLSDLTEQWKTYLWDKGYPYLIVD